MNIISLSRFMTHFSVSSVTSLPTTSLPIMLQEAEEVATNPSENVVPISNFHGVCISGIFVCYMLCGSWICTEYYSQILTVTVTVIT